MHLKGILTQLGFADEEQLKQYILAREAFLKPWSEFQTQYLDQAPLEKLFSADDLPSTQVEVLASVWHGNYADFTPLKAEYSPAEPLIAYSQHMKLYTNVVRGLLGDGECFQDNTILESKDLVEAVMKLTDELKRDRLNAPHQQHHVTAFLRNALQEREERIQARPAIKAEPEDQKPNEVLDQTLPRALHDLVAQHDRLAALQPSNPMDEALRVQILGIKEIFNRLFSMVEEAGGDTQGFAPFAVVAEKECFLKLKEEIEELQAKKELSYSQQERLQQARLAHDEFVHEMTDEWGGELPKQLVDMGFATL